MTAIQTATIGVESYGAVGAASAAQALKGPFPVDALGRIDQRPGAALERRPAGQLRLVAPPPDERPRTLERSARAGEERHRATEGAARPFSYSSPFLAQIIAQTLRPAEHLRTDVTPHEGFAVYRFATEQGIAYFGVLDPVDFAV